jgi:hypothetical protein
MMDCPRCGDRIVEGFYCVRCGHVPEAAFSSRVQKVQMFKSSRVGNKEAGTLNLEPLNLEQSAKR